MSEHTKIMKTQSTASQAASLSAPTEDDIRDYAYHLYEQSRCEPGHDLENWLEASACLKANIPANSSQSRLHQHINGPGRHTLQTTSI